MAINKKDIYKVIHLHSRVRVHILPYLIVKHISYFVFMLGGHSVFCNIQYTTQSSKGRDKRKQKKGKPSVLGLATPSHTDLK